MFDYKINHIDGVAVSDTYEWKPIMSCPSDVKVLLLTQHGIAVMGDYYSGGNFTHWAPLPRVPKENK